MLPRAIGTPCRTIEAWIFGDLESVRGVASLGARPRLPKIPEGDASASTAPEELQAFMHGHGTNEATAVSQEAVKVSPHGLLRDAPH
jgi:hypothetical protein